MKIAKQTQTKTTKVTPAEEDDENIVVTTGKPAKKQQTSVINQSEGTFSNQSLSSNEAFLTNDMDSAIRQRNELEKWSKLLTPSFILIRKSSYNFFLWERYRVNFEISKF